MSTIARIINVHTSIVSRELERKTGKRGQIKNRRWMDERPDINDGKSKLTLIEKSKTKAVDVITNKIIKILAPSKKRIHILTADNGKEFTWHEENAHSLEANFYFAQPYQSWEQDLNENPNGLIRQFCPKKFNFRKITDADLEKVMKLLNNRPRKNF